MELGKYNRGRSIFMRDWGGGSRLGRSCGEGGKERASEGARRRRRGTRTCTARGGPWRRGGGVPSAGPDRQATPTPWAWLRPRPRPQLSRHPQRQRSPRPTPADSGVSFLSAFRSWSLSGPARGPQVALSRLQLRFRFGLPAPDFVLVYIAALEILRISAAELSGLWISVLQSQQDLRKVTCNSGSGRQLVCSY